MFCCVNREMFCIQILDNFEMEDLKALIKIEGSIFVNVIITVTMLSL
jgi:hypothetical protein